MDRTTQRAQRLLSTNSPLDVLCADWASLEMAIGYLKPAPPTTPAIASLNILGLAVGRAFTSDRSNLPEALNGVDPDWPDGVMFPFVSLSDPGFRGVATVHLTQDDRDVAKWALAASQRIVAACEADLGSDARIPRFPRVLLPTLPTTFTGIIEGESYGLAILIAAWLAANPKYAQMRFKSVPIRACFAATGVVQPTGDLAAVPAETMASKLSAVERVGVSTVFVVQGQLGIPQRWKDKVVELPSARLSAHHRFLEWCRARRGIRIQPGQAGLRKLVGNWHAALRSEPPYRNLLQVRLALNDHLAGSPEAARLAALDDLVAMSAAEHDCSVLFLIVRAITTTHSLTDSERRAMRSAVLDALAKHWHVDREPTGLLCQKVGALTDPRSPRPTHLGLYLVSREEMARLLLRPEDRQFVQSPGKPVVDVNWFAAYTFCWWVGGALPTRAQWYAAYRMTTQRRLAQRRKPPPTATNGGGLRRGTEPPDHDANAAHAGTRGAPTDDPLDDPLLLTYACLGAYFQPKPVRWSDASCAPDQPRDMLGNVHEWLDDWSPEKNDLGEDVQSERDKVIAGGAFDTSCDTLRASLFWMQDVRWPQPNLGFRCSYPHNSTRIEIVPSDGARLDADAERIN